MFKNQSQPHGSKFGVQVMQVNYCFLILFDSDDEMEQDVEESGESGEIATENENKSF